MGANMNKFPFKAGQRIETPLDGSGVVIGGYRDVNLGWVVQVYLDVMPQNAYTRTHNFIANVLKPELDYHKEESLEESLENMKPLLKRKT